MPVQISNVPNSASKIGVATFAFDMAPSVPMLDRQMASTPPYLVRVQTVQFVRYSPNAFPSLWKQMETAAADGTIVAAQDVLLELERQDDDVFASAKRHVTLVPLKTKFRLARRKSSRSFRSW
jgi:hypothetical protein